MADEDTLTYGIDLDASGATKTLQDLENRSKSFGSALTSALKSATSGGGDLEDTLKSLATQLSGITLSSGLQPLQSSLSSLASSATSSLTSGFSSLFAFEKGGVPGSITPFASGGVVSSPTYFNMSGGSTGLMGEAGSEAIMPLKRGSDGSLGVATQGGAGGTSVNVSITTQDAASFTKSQSQISSMLARSVKRGQRNL
ncbi:phage tail tape measure protein [Allorhizobium taibaishanense]|uniref:Phage tail protein n=1 Tax=Allorhizobium taibaishanense TaxID=887144 RepID=A0A1Q8ZZJ9_9HYPH|nr:phage tail tape measure protein [Allorhizobium taibaishanense]MBB4007313.1 phage-related minor tail protein [Allorhizobium taibaishanense]OLP47706.1 phage tail protein [Allorhizobium taibaishanense]